MREAVYRYPMGHDGPSVAALAVLIVSVVALTCAVVALLQHVGRPLF